MMLRYFVVVLSVLNLFVSVHCIHPGPRFPPTKGEVWPKPQNQVKSENYLIYNPAHFKIVAVNNTCELVTSALERLGLVLSGTRHAARRTRRARSLRRTRLAQRAAHAQLRRLEIDLARPCEDYPHADMDESYGLSVAATSMLRSESVWGILRGLETFTQLFYISDDYNEVRVNETHINDYPQFPHRGLLLDTSRHFISLPNILLTLEAMAMNKMNVFHWHIVDDESFPFYSEKFPDLSAQGAFHPSMVYLKTDVDKVIEFARRRGIRVVPEFDVPGHTRSWGVAYPRILTKCYDGGEFVELGPMNPIHNETYKLLKDLFQELHSRFPDKYFHIGGDEVDLNCWESNPEIIEYMKQNNISRPSVLHAIFMRNAIPLLDPGTIPIVWQEVFDELVPLKKNTVIQVWKDTTGYELRRVLRAGFHALFSSSWYLDHLSSGGDWEKYYDVDLRELVSNATLAKNVMGGEACMWGEVVDDRNVISRVWPRASAVAEKLWSTSTEDNSESWVTNDVRYRLEEHTCRMIRAGINAEPPNGPGFCVA